jgi:hypothetical protein
MAKDKKINSKYKTTRQDLANPFKDISLQEKRKNAKSIDLTDNFFIEDLGNEYSKIIPIDKDKRF